MEYTIFQYIYFFFLYSFIGWVFEEVLAAFKYGRFVNRGFVNGPLCMKYGFCMIVILTDVSDLMDNPFLQFVMCFVIITVIQYVAAALVRKITGHRLWDYSGHKWNLNGYVSVRTSLFWSVTAMLCIWLVHPFLYILYELLPLRVLKVLEVVLLVLFAVDVLVTAATMLKWKIQGNVYDTVAAGLEKTKQSIGEKLIFMIQKRMYRAFPEMEHQEKSEADGFGKPVNRVFAKGLCFDKLFWIFFISALVGDWIETVFVWATSGVLMSRSSLLYGTFSIVWGLGGAIATGLLYSLQKRNDRYIFIAGFFMGGVYEYSCSVFTEVVFGTTFWDYSHMPFNINGRINLLFCFFWGIAAVVWFKGLYPVFSRWIERIPAKTGKPLVWLLIVFMTVNMAVSFMALWRSDERSRGVAAEASWQQVMDERFGDERLARIYPNAIKVE